MVCVGHADSTTARRAVTPRELVHHTVRTVRDSHGYAETVRLTAFMAFDYKAFLDASGTDKGQRVVSFGGTLATARNWVKFSKGWAAALTKHGVPLNQFHTTAVINAKDHFEGWSRGQRSELFADLIKVSRAYAMFHFGAAVRLSDFDAVAKRIGLPPETEPADICLQYCIGMILEWLPSGLPPEERVSFVFDQDSLKRMQVQQAIVRAMEEITTLGEKRLGGVTFQDRRLEMPLQLADVIAHQTFQHQRDEAFALGRARGVFIALNRGRPHKYQELRPAADDTLDALIEGSDTTRDQMVE